MRNVMRVALFIAALFTLSCAEVLPCDSSTCDGCCVDDVCHTGGEHDLCGSGACRQCGAGQTCSGQSCISSELYDGISVQISGFEDQAQLFFMMIPPSTDWVTASISCDSYNGASIEMLEAGTSVWSSSSTTSVTDNFPLAGRYEVRVRKSSTYSSCYNYYAIYSPPAPYDVQEKYCEPTTYKCTLTASWY